MRQGLADLLRSSGYTPVAIDDGDLQVGRENLSALIERIMALEAQLILLDINLAGVNGELLLKTLRSTCNTPVIMLTSSS